MKKTKRSCCVLFFLLISYSSGYAQIMPWKVTELIRQNILTYHFRFDLDADLNVKGKVIENYGHYAFDDLWSKEGNRLVLNIKKSDLVYPIKEFELFEIRGMNYNYEVDSIKGNYINLHRISSVSTYDTNYLVAYNKENGEVKFISGNFFQSRIVDDFKIDPTNVKSFIPYLKLRGFSWGLNEISFDKKKRDMLYFDGKDSENGKIIIKVSTKDLDQVELKKHYNKRTFVY